MKTRELVIIGLSAAAMEAAKISLAAIANVELVSLLTILFALVFQKRAYFIALIFVMLEFLLYGFGIWWIMYLYIWPLLVFLTLRFQKTESPLFWALLSGIYGLLFGALCAIPYFVIGGMAGGFSYWLSGIPYDIVHCVSNFVLALFLFRPLRSLLMKLEQSYH